GSPKDIARLESALATSLLAMRAEFDRRLYDPKHYDAYIKIGWGAHGVPFAGVTDSLDPFRHYRLWESLVLPEPKPKRRKKKKKDVIPSYWRRPNPIPEPPGDAEFEVDWGVAMRLDPSIRRRRPQDELDRHKDQVDGIRTDGTDLFDRISFVSDGTAVTVELLGLGFGAQVLSTGFSAVAMLASTFVSIGSGAQGSAEAANLWGFKLTAIQYRKQIARRKGKGVRVSVNRAVIDVMRYDKVRFIQARLGPSMSESTFTTYFMKGAREAAQVANDIADLADRTTRHQVNMSNLRFKYSQQRIEERFVEEAHKRRLRFYDKFLRQAKIIRR
ncbi:MAG: hypothetical protein AAFX50_19535, partial [Acidobacteriota bacterium]